MQLSGLAMTIQSSYPYLYHYNIASFVASVAIPLGYWRPFSVIYGAVIPVQAYFWPSKMHARLCKSIQWLLLRLILHEHVTLFRRPLCFQSMPLHLFIFSPPFFFLLSSHETDRPVNMAGHKVNGACLMAEIDLWWQHSCFEWLEIITYWL